MSKNYNLSKAQANAAAIGVVVKPSESKNKKLDVFDKEGKKLASIGHPDYQDYTVHGDSQRLRLYRKRFDYCRKKKDTACYYADNILWR